LKQKRDLALELLDKEDIAVPSEDLENTIKKDLLKVRDRIEEIKKSGLAKEVSKKQAEESQLQRIITLLADI
jgi:hypothetical protein